MGHVVAVCTVIVTILREIGGAVVGTVHGGPAGVHVLGVVVIWVVVSLFEAYVVVSPVGPVVPDLAFGCVVGVDDVSPQFRFQILAALAGLVPVDLLQLVRLQHVYLGLLLHVRGSQVLFGVVVASEGPALPHETDPAQDEQEDQEQNAAYSPSDDGPQAAVGQGGQRRGGEERAVPVHIGADCRGVAEQRSGGAGGQRGGGRICGDQKKKKIKWTESEQSQCN